MYPHSSREDINPTRQTEHQLTAADAVAQSDVDPAGHLLIEQPQWQSTDLEHVDDEPADQEHVADDQVAQELRFQHLPEPHGSAKVAQHDTLDPNCVIILQGL